VTYWTQRLTQRHTIQRCDLKLDCIVSYFRPAYQSAVLSRFGRVGYRLDGYQWIHWVGGVVPPTTTARIAEVRGPVLAVATL